MLQLIIAAILILCNGLFALSELAIVSSRKARLEARAADGSKGARTALQLLEHPGRFLSTVQIGITLVGILAGAFSGAALGGEVAVWLRELGVRKLLADPAGYAIVLGLITYFSVVLGELVPKHMALRNPEPIACTMAPAMLLLSRLAAPLVWLLDNSAKLVIRMLGSAPEDDGRVSDEEIRALIAEAARTGVIAPDEREMMAAVMRFGDRNVRSVMTARIDIETIDLSHDTSVIAEKLRTYGHSTILVSEGGPDRIVGVLRLRDLIADLLTGPDTNGALSAGTIDHELIRRHLRKSPVLPDTVPALRALETLRKSPVAVATVRDEYGNFEGIVTPADILDALAGAFRSDSFPREKTARHRDDGSWDLSGAMPADEMAELLDIKLPQHRGYETLGGFLITELAQIPKPGDRLTTRNWEFTIVTMKDLRVDNVHAQPVANSGAD